MAKFSIAIILTLLINGSAISQNSTSSSPPNILIITIDNVGYGDLNVYNKESPIKTPNIDRFTKEGARLTDFYTASPTCTVSRASLLTGRVPQRHQLVNQLAGISGNYDIGLRQSEILIPEVLQKRLWNMKPGLLADGI